jgi:hypothetical protein
MGCLRKAALCVFLWKSGGGGSVVCGGGRWEHRTPTPQTPSHTQLNAPAHPPPHTHTLSVAMACAALPTSFSPILPAMVLGDRAYKAACALPITAHDDDESWEPQYLPMLTSAKAVGFPSTVCAGYGAGADARARRGEGWEGWPAVRPCATRTGRAPSCAAVSHALLQSRSTPPSRALRVRVECGACACACARLRRQAHHGCLGLLAGWCCASGAAVFYNIVTFKTDIPRTGSVSCRHGWLSPSLAKCIGCTSMLFVPANELECDLLRSFDSGACCPSPVVLSGSHILCLSRALRCFHALAFENY